MIVIIEGIGDRMVFANVTRIQEEPKLSIFSDEPRKVIFLFSGEKILAGGDDIDLGTTKVTVLPNPEREPS